MDEPFIDYRPLMVRNREPVEPVFSDVEKEELTMVEDQIPWSALARALKGQQLAAEDEAERVRLRQFAWDAKVNLALSEGLNPWSEDVYDFDDPAELLRFEEYRLPEVTDG